MPPEPTEPTTPGTGTSTQPQQQSPPQQTEGKTFTQAEVDAIVAKAKSKAEKAAEKRLTQTAPTAQPNTPPAATAAPAGETDLASQLAQLTQRLDQSEADRAFAETIATVGGDIEKLKELRPLFDPNKPDAFIEKAKKLGLAAAPPRKGDDDDEDDGNPGNSQAPSMFRSPGAPSGPPSGVIENDPTKWTKDYIQRLRADGTFLKEIEKWAETLPGGGNGVFRKRIPKG